MRLLLTLVALALLGPAPALGRTPGNPNDQKLAAAAQSAFAAGRFSDALNGYIEASQVKQRPEYLLGIARCHAQMGNFEPARDFYRRYLATTPADATATREAAEVNEKFAAAEAERKAKAELEGQAEVARARERAAHAETELTTRRKDLEVAKAESAKAEGEAAARRQAELQAVQQMFSTADVEIAEQNRVVNKWWFWTAIGAAAAGAVTVYVATAPGPRPTTLAPINAR